MKFNRNTVLTLFLLAFFVQLIIIIYNYMTGYYAIPNAANFLIRLAIGTSFSFVFALVLVYLDLKVITKLDNHLSLPEKLLYRVPVELCLSVFWGVAVGSFITFISDLLMPYKDGLFKNLINNSLITSVINILIITVIEAIVWFKRSQYSLLKAEILEKENSKIRFETLKSQLNPHFLFNSLNVLSSLIQKDSEKAQKFVDAFSSVYRYTLDVIDKNVVELREEIEFAKSYLYLQKIRFDNAINIQFNVDVTMLNHFVPPLAVQTLLENAFKHNKATNECPLIIKIYCESDLLIMVNNYQPKIKGNDSRGVGLSNLNKRYKLLGEQIPQYLLTDTEYIAKIPLIDPE